MSGHWVYLKLRVDGASRRELRVRVPSLPGGEQLEAKNIEVVVSRVSRSGRGRLTSWTEAGKAHLLEMRRRGLSLRAIADTMGRSTSNIRQVLQKLAPELVKADGPSNGEAWHSADDLALVHMWNKERLDTHEIARRLDRSPIGITWRIKVLRQRGIDITRRRTLRVQKPHVEPLDVDEEFVEEFLEATSRQVPAPPPPVQHFAKFATGITDPWADDEPIGK